MTARLGRRLTEREAALTTRGNSVNENQPLESHTPSFDAKEAEGPRRWWGDPAMQSMHGGRSEQAKYSPATDFPKAAGGAAAVRRLKRSARAASYAETVSSYPSCHDIAICTLGN